MCFNMYNFEIFDKLLDCNLKATAKFVFMCWNMYNFEIFDSLLDCNLKAIAKFVFMYTHITLSGQHAYFNMLDIKIME